jgi:hypothetical protein
MEAVRKIISADMLKSVIELPWMSKGLQVEVIITPIEKEASQQQKVSVDSLEGCLQNYANPALWAKEQYAWENNIMEKYGHI